MFLKNKLNKQKKKVEEKNKRNITHTKTKNINKTKGQNENPLATCLVCLS